MIEELVKKAKKGNVEAFEQIILYYKNDLYKIAQVRLKKPDDIDDAIQETIISAYQSIHKLINISKFKTWLITILINQCNRIYNKNKKNNTISYEFIEAEKFVSKDYISDINYEFDELIKSLDIDEKTILVLYYCNGYKTKEISKILNINENTVRSKMLRAKNKLKEELKEDCIYG